MRPMPTFPVLGKPKPKGVPVAKPEPPKPIQPPSKPIARPPAPPAPVDARQPRPAAPDRPKKRPPMRVAKQPDRSWGIEAKLNGHWTPAIVGMDRQYAEVMLERATRRH